MNEAFNTTGFEQRVRDRAYALWESEGRPFGRDAEHWRMSEDGMRAELAKPAPAKPAHSKKSARKRSAARH
ncbi:MAG TPA: DUF2934 domain-containing protein [Roseiarcus sp.]|nr:DUF2934 domain-containing protein [Roseiarcus sp.]